MCNLYKSRQDEDECQRKAEEAYKKLEAKA
jgi:hypothetical protein